MNFLFFPSYALVVFVACPTVLPHGMEAYRVLCGKGIIQDLSILVR